MGVMHRGTGYRFCLLGMIIQAACTPSAKPAVPTGESQTSAPLSATIDQGPVVATITTTKGRTVSIIQSEERDPGELPQPATPQALSDEFTGTARKASKLSIVSAEIEGFDSVESLWQTLEDDEAMMHRSPPISHAATSRRVAEERRRVSVDGVLGAASRESDNDFHLILCDTVTGPANQRFCINVEVSGLPPSGVFRKRLISARQQFSDLLGGNFPGDKYAFYKPAIPVTVTGSLFYDIDHKPGTVGPQALRPDTAWEIHPVDTLVER